MGLARGFREIVNVGRGLGKDVILRPFSGLMLRSGTSIRHALVLGFLEREGL